MKTNIIHILIIAIILIAGWSLFTVLQDFYNADPKNFDNYSMIGKGKQYLPLTPESYSHQQKYPVYKVPSHIQTKITQSQSARNNVSYREVDNHLSVNTNQIISPTTNTSNRAKSNAFHSIQMTKSSPPDIDRTSKSLSKHRKMTANTDIANTTTLQSNIGSAFYRDDKVIKVYRNEANVYGRRGGKGDAKDFNAVPVGDGFYLLILMAALYTFFKIPKK